MTENQSVISPKHSFISIKQLPSLLTSIFVLLIIYAFLSGIIYRFYANFVFLFYSLLKSMWVSVVCLGIFQTILLIPFRVVSLKNATNIEEFEEKIGEIKKEERRNLFQTKFKEGNKALLFYIVNFFVQITSYISIGKLFLTDFYTKPLDQKILYSFVRYPQYPIRDTFFKIPYPFITKTVDLGIHLMLLIWIIIICLKIITTIINNYQKKAQKNLTPEKPDDSIIKILKILFNLINNNFIWLLFLGWLLTRRFPVGWQIRIFSGDVSHPYPAFNTLTAICASLVVVWLDLPKINEKIKIARAANISPSIIRKTELELFKQTLLSAILIGIAAYYITNQIPCAFELSIFTFEVISWISPFTLDKLILRTSQSKS